MSKFNPVERYLAKILSNLPGVKKNLKKSYQVINYLIYKKKYSFKSDYLIKRISYSNQESFFGYYDKSPLNENGKNLIFHSSGSLSTEKQPSALYPVDIILYDTETENYSIIDKSYSYNWQQGARLQWLDPDRFIYNVYENGEYKSKIYNILTGVVEKHIDYPVYDCYRDIFALTLNFDRLTKLNSDYGYVNKKNVEVELNNFNDGIFYVDLHTNKQNLLISIQDVIAIHQKKSMENAKHKFNHIMIVPDGNSFIFIHRWYPENGRRLDSLILYNIKTKQLRVLADDEMVSHCCWYDDKIIGFLRDKTLGDNYYIIDPENGDKQILSKEVSGFGDGHPSVFNNTILFDTYPDKARMKHLFVYDIKKQETKKIGEFLESLKYYAKTRCDLHPRWSNDGNTIFFDSVHDGKRNLYLLAYKNKKC